ncbi:unnamed protein product [Arabis nemorensis]|uniref:F-box domain-containing protein n=1 Tax=Arabis nemorensis TaxID=586526 RepID=A0A565CLK6_9BRAS|nr:unnamed protein product [Arabis nemorensis]
MKKQSDVFEISGDDDIDRLSNLPDFLLCHILLNLPTKDVVKSSVLSKRWRDLWPLVPGLDLKSGHFPAFVTFVDRFLGFNRRSRLQKLKLESQSHVIWWINTVLKRKIQHLHAIYNFSRCEGVPLFRNLSLLHVQFDDYRWETLPIFLESCPNLKSLLG